MYQHHDSTNDRHRATIIYHNDYKNTHLVTLIVISSIRDERSRHSNDKYSNILWLNRMIMHHELIKHIIIAIINLTISWIYVEINKTYKPHWHLNQKHLICVKINLALSYKFQINSNIQRFKAYIYIIFNQIPYEYLPFWWI